MSIEKESELEREPTRERVLEWLEHQISHHVANKHDPSLPRAAIAFLRAPALVLSEAELIALGDAANAYDVMANLHTSIKYGVGDEAKPFLAIAATLRSIASRGKL